MKLYIDRWLKKLTILTLCYGLLLGSPSLAQEIKGFYHFKQIKTDSLFNSKQIISIVSLPINGSHNYAPDIAYESVKLKPTSTFASETNAIIAINGSFFDMKNGGSITYLEINDSLITPSGPKQLPDSLLNGVIILTKSNEVKFEIKKADSLYLKSKNEKAVLGTGPILLHDGTKASMPEKLFVSKRHPRTCLCTTADSLLLITIDGRSTNAAGMNLYELQDFLTTQDCLEAINLDGGGSTTLWIRNRGVVNYPSDKTGERNVANVIIIKRNKNQDLDN